MKKTISFTLSLAAALSTLACSSEYEITSSEFKDGDALPATATCEGKEFGMGVSPELSWKNGPDGTVTYAISLKDWTAINNNPPELQMRGYHWVVWDIPEAHTSLPAAVANEQFITGMDGAQQFGAFGAPNFGYFGPCPSFSFNCAGNVTPRANDDYSFVVYALPANLPAPPTLEQGAADGVNYQMLLDQYFMANALEFTEIKFTSDAAPAVGFACPET